MTHCHYELACAYLCERITAHIYIHRVFWTRLHVAYSWPRWLLSVTPILRSEPSVEGGDASARLHRAHSLSVSLSISDTFIHQASHSSFALSIRHVDCHLIPSTKHYNSPFFRTACRSPSHSSFSIDSPLSVITIACLKF